MTMTVRKDHAVARFTVTFRDGRVRSYGTLNGAMRARRPGAVVRSIAKGTVITGAKGSAQ